MNPDFKTIIVVKNPDPKWRGVEPCELRISLIDGKYRCTSSVHWKTFGWSGNPSDFDNPFDTELEAIKHEIEYIKRNLLRMDAGDLVKKIALWESQQVELAPKQEQLEFSL